MTTDWTTRGELLTERAARLRELERARYGWRRDVKPGAAMLVAMVLAISVALAREDDPSTRTTAIWWGITAVAVAVLLLVLWQRVRTSRAMDRERLAWAGADRTRDARALPPGDIPDELLTIFDARDRPDLEEVSSRVGLTNLGRIYDTRLLWPAFRAIAPWCFGVVLLASGLIADDLAAGIPLVVVGTIVLVATTTTIGAVWVETFRRQQGLNGGYDRQLYAARAAALGGQPAAEPGQVPLAARIAVGLLAVAIAGFLVVRVLMASALALLIVLAIVAVAALLIAPPLLRRRVLHVVPQTTGGGTVLDPPRRQIAVDLVGDAIVIRALAGDVAPATIPLTDVLAVADVHLGYPFAPPAVGIVTRDENIVLAGSAVKDLPALQQPLPRPSQPDRIGR